ncbi:hypothetical protein CYY_007590 [Polysphondylium violaceum]|uniref:ABC transporter domain-containing protein n=1 Tax=Polysphondylium violaceum TaxID=133409 RepID=A0A8J4UQS6_9MYCE|nr:hypothetical protein CYY_007590 [Polysphondylium violaceum]
MEEIDNSNNSPSYRDDIPIPDNNTPLEEGGVELQQIKFKKVGSSDAIVDINPSNLEQHIREKLTNSPDKTGMYVTAKNLSFYVDNGKKKVSEFEKRTYLLNDLSFSLKPGRMVLLMGSPGAGKSVLIKTLADRMSAGTLEGELLFNNRPIDHETHQKDTIYVNQEDRHIALLTVKETLEFSAQCNMGENVSEQEKKERVDMILEQLGLSHTVNTIIGNQFFRGISGGQKRRVTIASEFTKCPNLILMDEPTTGLDSATAFNVCNKVKSITIEGKTSTIISLLQPSPELTNLFDDVMILSEHGKLAYFGPMESMLPYFESINISPLPNQPLAEFIQEVAEDPKKYISDGSDQVEHIDLQKLFKESIYYQGVQDLINQHSSITNLTDHSNGNNHENSMKYEFKLLLQRHLKIMKILRPQYVTRWVQALFMGFVVGSLFFQMGNTQADARNRFGLIYYAMVLHIWTTIGSIEEFYTLRSIYYDQKDGKFYKPFGYFITIVITKFPIAIIEALLFSITCYWISGFRARADSFLIFVLGMFLTNIIAQGIFQACSAFVESQLMTSLITPAIVVLCMIFSGYMLPKPQIPGWWIWTHYLSPLKYVIDMISSNELYGLTFGCSPEELIPPPSAEDFISVYQGVQICPITEGEVFLKQFGMSENFYFRWIDIVIVLAFAIALFGLFYVGLVYVKFEAKKPPKTVDQKKKKAKKDKKVVASSHHMKGCYMTIQNLNYFVDSVQKNKETGKNEKVKLHLLTNVNGYVVPGMCALMGPSGAGKSTLLDVLSRRKNMGEITGEIKVNNQSIEDINLNRFTAYVEQQDILSANLTVFEAIEFSANCRLPASYSISDKEKLINEILEVLNLNKLKNTKIGANPTIGISLANRKKVSIGIELASDPHLLFLDEPTSGLDSTAALKVMNCVKKIADTGRTVICTIHQPSQEIFEKFDQLLLLDKGNVIYFGKTGEDSKEVVEYFTNLGYQHDEKRNPADFILEIAENKTHLNPIESYKESIQCRETISKLADISSIVPEGHDIPKYKGLYSAPFGIIMRSLLKRAWLNHVRRPQTIVLRFLRSFIPALVIGTMFLRLGNDQSDARNKIAMVFLGFLFAGMASIGKIPTVIEDRSVYYRDSASGTYPPVLYLLAGFITDIPMCLLTTFSYWIPFYFLTGLAIGDHGSKFFFSLGVFFLVVMTYDALAMCFALTLPTIPIATLFNGMSLNMYGLFGGFFIPRVNIPKAWLFMHYAVGSKYGLETLSVNELEDQPFYCPNNEGAYEISLPNNSTVYYCPINNGNDMIARYGFDRDRKGWNCLILGGYIIGYTFIGYLALKYIKHMKR